jgi:flagellar biosynthesis/type III secretory pathway protein FliH
MASILKPDQQPTAQARASELRGLAGFNLDDFAAAGVRHLEAIRAEAARILAAAREEGERLRVEAQQQGQRDGFAAGMHEAEEKIRGDVAQQLAERLPALEATVQQLADLQKQYLEEFREALVPTALAAAERMVLARLEHEPEVLTRWAESALEYAKTSRKIALVVHPETLVSHGEALEQMLVAPGMPEDSRLEADASVEPWSVTVRSEGGAVMLSLSGQLERLDAMLRGELRHDEDSPAMRSDERAAGDGAERRAAGDGAERADASAEATERVTDEQDHVTGDAAQRRPPQPGDARDEHGGSSPES